MCPNRWIPRSINDSGVPSGACIVVEGTVYGDGEGDAAGKDYAEYAPLSQRDELY